MKTKKSPPKEYPIQVVQEGDRVRMRKFEDQPECTAEVAGIEVKLRIGRNKSTVYEVLVTLYIDHEYRSGPDDDGLCECGVEQIKEVL
jgi:hypothetical protein